MTADLIRALEFYSDPAHYKAPFTGGMGALYFDCGSKAREAIAAHRAQAPAEGDEVRDAAQALISFLWKTPLDGIPFHLVADLKQALDAQAQPKGAPVAEVVVEGGNGRRLEWKQTFGAWDIPEPGTKLYAHPVQAPAPEPQISTEHGPWLPSQHDEGETYCKRCLTRSIFADKRKCDPHIVYPANASPAVQHGNPLAVPFGMALVPQKATLAMLRAAAGWGAPENTWAAMLAAAPTVAPLTLETAEEARKDRAHAEAYYRQAERLLTANEQTLHAEVQRLRSAAQRTAETFGAYLDRDDVPTCLEAIRGLEALRAVLEESQRTAALTTDDLDLCRQWFNSVQDTNGGYLNLADYELAERIYRALGLRVPSSITDQLGFFKPPVQGQAS